MLGVQLSILSAYASTECLYSALSTAAIYTSPQDHQPNCFHLLLYSPLSFSVFLFSFQQLRSVFGFCIKVWSINCHFLCNILRQKGSIEACWRCFIVFTLSWNRTIQTKKYNPRKKTILFVKTGEKLIGNHKQVCSWFLQVSLAADSSS